MKGAVLVTGASGFIGTALCRHLIRQERRVVAVVMSFTTLRPSAMPMPAAAPEAEPSARVLVTPLCVARASSCRRDG